jgi:hypothetical protein
MRFINLEIGRLREMGLNPPDAKSLEETHNAGVFEWQRRTMLV